MLTIISNDKEVLKYLSDMNVDFIVGPDCYTTVFYLNYWSIIKDDLFGAIRDFFCISYIPKYFTTTFIYLTPKVLNLDGWNDFITIVFKLT